MPLEQRLGMTCPSSALACQHDVTVPIFRRPPNDGFWAVLVSLRPNTVCYQHGGGGGHKYALALPTVHACRGGSPGCLWMAFAFFLGYAPADFNAEVEENACVLAWRPAKKARRHRK